MPELKYEDGLKFIYFFTSGTKGGSEPIRTMLQYLQHSTADNARDESTKELHDYVSRVKTAPEVKEGYMRFEELIAFERADAAKQATLEVTHATKVQAILELLEDYGEIPEALERMLAQASPEALKTYHKLAAKADSIETFMAAISPAPAWGRL